MVIAGRNTGALLYACIALEQQLTNIISGKQMARFDRAQKGGFQIVNDFQRE